MADKVRPETLEHLRVIRAQPDRPELDEERRARLEGLRERLTDHRESPQA